MKIHSTEGDAVPTSQGTRGIVGVQERSSGGRRYNSDETTDIYGVNKAKVAPGKDDL